MSVTRSIRQVLSRRSPVRPNWEELHARHETERLRAALLDERTTFAGRATILPH